MRSYAWPGKRWLPLLLVLMATLFLPGSQATAGPPEAHVWVRDSLFNPAMLRIPVGATVVFHFEGRSPHTVTAEDGSFESGFLNRGQQFRVTFDKPGRYPFYCKPHGHPGGKGMAGVIVVGEGGDDTFQEHQVRLVPRLIGPETIRVPQDAPTIQEAVNRAYPEDLILIAPGIYKESVVVLTPRLTIRGLDRNKVILDGQLEMDNGIKVLGADGVVIENLTARHYTLNGFYWTGVRGYRGSYLTAYNNGDYGVYAFDSQFGQFDHSYASGNPDSGFYIGQCKPCNALITDVISEHNGLGYSGTNAGGDLTITNSVWRNNFGGLVPNTLDTERLAPQVGTRIVNNVIVSNGNASAPAKRITIAAYGVGVALAGGNHNVVEGNLIADHPTFGVLVAPNVDENFWLAAGNVVRGNQVAGSGYADLALAAPAGAGNCFEGNQAARSIPGAIESVYACGTTLSRLGGGELAATTVMLSKVLRLELGLPVKVGDWRDFPAPPEQPTLPNPLSQPAPAWPTPESEALARLEVRVPAMPSDFSTLPMGIGSATEGTKMSQWWIMGFGLYVYLLPFVLYTCWVTVAVWDILRRDDRSMGAKLGWIGAVLLLPLLGPVAYYAAGRSPIPGLLRFGLVGGGLALYLLLALAMVGLAPV